MDINSAKKFLQERVGYLWKRRCWNKKIKRSKI